MELPDSAFFRACKEGDEAYVSEILASGSEFDWKKTFRYLEGARAMGV